MGDNMNIRPLIEIPQTPETASRRRDHAYARIVDHSIFFQKVKSTRDAASYLKEKGVRMEVALRVLSQPLRRRFIS